MSQSRLQQLLDEHDALYDEYIETAMDKERKQHSFVNQIEITNQKTGEVFRMSHTLQKKLIEQHSMLEQRIGYIHHLAKQQELSEVFFLTITAPSQYHPFRMQNDKKILNRNFGFDTIKEAVEASYKAVESISRLFYKSLKERLRGLGRDEQLMFVKVNEFHDSFIVHQHMMIFLPVNIKVHLNKRNGRVIGLGTWAREKFYEILKREDFNYNRHPLRKTNDFKRVNDDGRSLSQYMMKYIQKTLSMSKADGYGQNSTIYFLYGWKTTNRIRHYSTSRVPFNVIEYQKLYHALGKEEKSRLIARATANKTNLMTELSKVVSIKRKVYEKNIFLNRHVAINGKITDTPVNEGDASLETTKQPLRCENPLFIIESSTHKSKRIVQRNDNDNSIVKDKRELVELEIRKDGATIYKKTDFRA